MKKTPTYEEFRDTIWKRVIDAAGGKWDEEDLEKYLQKEEDGIVYEYEKALKEYNTGVTTYQQFTEGIPASIAYDLRMSY